MAAIIANEPIDFVQLTYNIKETAAENVLLSLVKKYKKALIVNRPLDGGNLFNKVSGKKLPSWASDYEIKNWSQYFLKYVISHPDVTCAIPATSKVEHMVENMGACYGRLPDLQSREKMKQHFASL